MDVGIGEGVEDGSLVGDDVMVGEAVAVAVGLGVDVAVGLGVRVGVKVKDGPGVGVLVGAFVGVRVGGTKGSSSVVGITVSTRATSLCNSVARNS